jgi:hypothetical protein
MTTTATRAPEFTWRKTKGNEWVVYSDHAALKTKVGCFVTVRSAKGETKEVQVVRLGNPFLVNGQRKVYGYIAQAPRSASTSASTCDECGRNGARHQRFDSSGIGGLVCDRCNRCESYELSFA